MHMHIHTHMQALFRIPRDPPPRLAEPSAWSADFAHWLSCTLQKEPERRVDAATLRSHPFAAGAGDAAAHKIKVILRVMDWADFVGRFVG